MLHKFVAVYLFEIAAEMRLNLAKHLFFILKDIFHHSKHYMKGIK